MPPWKPASPTPLATAASSGWSCSSAISPIVQIGTISRNRRSASASRSASSVGERSTVRPSPRSTVA
jgi:hypothetical protein